MENKKINSNDDFSLQAYFKEIGRYNVLSFDEEIEYACRIEQGDKEALDSLINANLRLVIGIAKFHATHEMGLTDLIQEGNLGLIRAAKKYDYRKNVRFSTYAAFWIKQFINNAISQKRRAIRIPRRWEENIKRISRVTHEFVQENHREPNMQELSQWSGMDIEEITKTYQMKNPTISLDLDLDGGSESVMNFIQNEDYTPETMLFKKSMREDAMNFLNMLQENEKKVLMYRFAMEGGEKQTLRKIAQKMGISSETVRQIQMRAMNKLKIKARPIKQYVMN